MAGLVRLAFVLIFLTLGIAKATSADFWPLRNYDIRNWSVNEGLPQVSVYDIAKDSQGYLWLATEKGLVRFDGHSFKTFSRENTPLLENPRIKKLLWYGKNNELLVATDSAFFSLKDNVFTAIDTTKTPAHRLLDMQLLSDGVVYVAAGSLFEYQNGTLVEMPFALENVNQLAEINGRLCLSTNAKFGCVSGNRFIPLGASFPEHWQIHHIIEYQNKVLLGTEHGLYRLGDDQQWQPIALEPSNQQARIRALFKQNANTLWVGTDTQVYRLYQDQVRESLHYRDDPIISLIMTGFTDEKGTLWLGTQISGLIKTELNAASHIPSTEGISEEFIWSVGLLDNQILVGTASGLFLETPEHRFAPVKLTPEPNNRAIYSQLYRRDQQEIWLGTKGGLAVYDSVHFEQRQQFKELARVQINNMFESETGIVWVGTQAGLWFYDGETLSSHPFFNKNQFGGIRYIYEYDNKLWIGTERGLFKQNGNSFTPVQNDILSKTFISYIGQLNNGKLMIGTFQHGLFVESEQGLWRQYSVSDGLPMDNITYLRDLGDKLLWAGLQGVMVVDVASLVSDVRKYSVIVDNTGEATRRERNRCCNGAGANKGLTLAEASYFPTVNGVLKVEHNLLNIPDPATRPLFEEFEANNTPVQAPYVLEPENKDWRFKFTSPTYGPNNELEFRYQLEGYDKAWKYTAKQREAIYTNLPGGDYVFKVQAKINGHPKWSDSTEVHLRKKRYWYEMWWFYVATTLVLCGLFVFAWKARTRTMRLKQIELRQEVEKRTSELFAANQRLLEANEQLRAVSFKDALTGLHNRRYLSESMSDILHQSKEHQSIAVLVVDLDNFKQINDQHGHNIGDEVLVKFAHILSVHCGEQDHVMRWGGEEFIVIAEHSTKMDVFAEEITQVMRQTEWPQNIPVRASIGLFSLACLKPNVRVFELALTMADKAMYAIKTQGKDGWLWLKTNTIIAQEQLEDLHHLDIADIIKDPAITVQSSHTRHNPSQR